MHNTKRKYQPTPIDPIALAKAIEVAKRLKANNPELCKSSQ